MSIRKFLIILIICFILQPGIPVLADSPTVSDISQELICQCGCTLTVASCTHAECVSREAIMAIIKDKLAQGQSKDEILRFFVTMYGEQVLASPPKQGLNLVAWLLPFTGLLIGIGVIYIVTKKWVRQGKHSQTIITNEAEETDDEYQKRLEQELKDFTEGGFR